MGGISFFKYYSFFCSSSLVFVPSQSISSSFLLFTALFAFCPSFSCLFYCPRSSSVTSVHLPMSSLFFASSSPFLLTLIIFILCLLLLSLFACLISIQLSSLLFTFISFVVDYFHYIQPRFCIFFLFRLDYFHRCLVFSFSFFLSFFTFSAAYIFHFYKVGICFFILIFCIYIIVLSLTLSFLSSLIVLFSFLFSLYAHIF